MFPKLESKSDILKMLDEMTAKRKPILEYCRTMNEEQLNNPVYPGTWSILQNLSHLAWAEAWMLAWIQKRPNPLPNEERPADVPLNLPAISKALDEEHAAMIAFVKGNPEAVLKEKTLYSKTGEQSVGGVLYHLIGHEVHHRAFIWHKLEKLLGLKRS